MEKNEEKAGAVGYIRDDGIQELNEGRLNIALWANPSFGVKTPVYLAPPAAVPLEELVKLKEAYCRCDGTQEAEDAAILAILNKIDELTHPTMTAPPAAVPMEALEGLVREWRKRADHLEVSGKWGMADALRQQADELTQLIKLIKESSND